MARLESIAAAGFFFDALERERAALGMTATRFAATVGISQPYFSQLRSGARPVPIDGPFVEGVRRRFPHLAEALAEAQPQYVGFFDRWTPEMAYVLGYAFADGHVEPAPSYRLALAGKDAEYMRGIAALMGMPELPLNRFSSTWGVRLAGRLMVERLAVLGLNAGKHSTNMLFPAMQPQFVPAFVRGYFDGDGTVTRHHRGQPRVAFYSDSYPFLDTLASVIADAGVARRRPNQRPDRPGEFYLLYGVRFTRVLREWMYADGGFCMERKREALWRA